MVTIPAPNGTLAPQYNDNEFSVMTYASYLGANTAGATEAWPGSSPQSYMMFDIAALQALYGANFSKVGTRSTYTWDNATGQESINGKNAPDTGVTSAHKIFSTVWTMGAVTTYDLSNFSDNQVDDLRPGHWLTFSHSQLADLNNQAAPGTAQFQGAGQHLQLAALSRQHRTPRSPRSSPASAMTRSSATTSTTS